MPKSIATDLVSFYEKYYKKHLIFLFRECLTAEGSCAMIFSNKMDNCIVKSILEDLSVL